MKALHWRLKDLDTLTVRSRKTVWFTLVSLVTGCAVQHGVVDFPNPLFDVHLGTFGVICFPSFTVFRLGGTYFTLLLPFYVPLILSFVAGLALISLSRRRHAQTR